MTCEQPTDDTEHIDAEYINVDQNASRFAPAQSTIRYQDLENGHRIEGRGLDGDGELQRFAHIEVSPDAAVELAQQILQVHPDAAVELAQQILHVQSEDADGPAVQTSLDHNSSDTNGT